MTLQPEGTARLDADNNKSWPLAPEEVRTFVGNPRITFRPLKLAISTSKQARLIVDASVHQADYPMGSCDLWARAVKQSSTAFIHEFEVLHALTPANQIRVKILNRGKFDVTVYVQVDGVGMILFL